MGPRDAATIFDCLHSYEHLLKTSGRFPDVGHKGAANPNPAPAHALNACLTAGHKWVVCGWHSTSARPSKPSHAANTTRRILTCRSGRLCPRHPTSLASLATPLVDSRRLVVVTDVRTKTGQLPRLHPRPAGNPPQGCHGHLRPASQPAPHDSLHRNACCNNHPRSDSTHHCSHSPTTALSSAANRLPAGLASTSRSLFSAPTWRVFPASTPTSSPSTSISSRP